MAEPAIAPPDYDATWQTVYGDIQERGPVHRHMRRILDSLLSGLSYDSVLDVGCGAGDNLALLCDSRQVKRVAGIDISEEALARARRRRPGDYTQLDIQESRLDERFDLVFSSLVLEHLAHDGTALANMRAMTAKHLVVTTIAGDYERYRPWEEQMCHVRNYRVGELEDKLRSAGFSPRETIYWGWPFYSPVARTLQNRMTSEVAYDRSTRLVAAAMYWLYHLNSRRRGDLVVMRADPV